jgi:hypothetical protein
MRMAVKLSHSERQKFERMRERRKSLAEAFASLGPEERLAYIPAGHAPSEFEIQSFLYESLKQLGYEVRGEVLSKCGTCIFDIVVYVDGKPARIVEVKKSVRAKSRKARSSREVQIDRYGGFGIPVDLVCTLSLAREYIARFPRA